MKRRMSIVEYVVEEEGSRCPWCRSENIEGMKCDREEGKILAPSRYPREMVSKMICHACGREWCDAWSMIRFMECSEAERLHANCVVWDDARKEADRKFLKRMGWAQSESGAISR